MTIVVIVVVVAHRVLSREQLFSPARILNWSIQIDSQVSLGSIIISESDDLFGWYYTHTRDVMLLEFSEMVWSMVIETVFEEVKNGCWWWSVTTLIKISIELTNNERTGDAHWRN